MIMIHSGENVSKNLHEFLKLKNGVSARTLCRFQENRRADFTVFAIMFTDQIQKHFNFFFQIISALSFSIHVMAKYLPYFMQVRVIFIQTV